MFRCKYSIRIYVHVEHHTVIQSDWKLQWESGEESDKVGWTSGTNGRGTVDEESRCA